MPREVLLDTNLQPPCNKTQTIIQLGNDKKEKDQTFVWSLVLVAEAGLEPTTFGL